MQAIRPLLLAVAACALAYTAQAQIEEVQSPRRPMTFDDMFAFGRVSDPQLSPDGRTILYVVTTYSVDANTSNSDIYAAATAGGPPRRLTTAPKADRRPRWSPDGQTVAFISERDGTPQIWTMHPDGTDQRALTQVATGADGVEWSPTGAFLVFTSSVYADCPDAACNAAREAERERNPVKARILDALPYRVWNAWRDGTVSHLFSVPAGGGTPRDLTPGAFDTPPIDIGGDPDYAVSPDGTEIAFVRNTDRFPAASTNNDVWIANADGTNARCITAANAANDNEPVYSPDGKYLAFRAMHRPGYESDTYDLIVYERATGRIADLTHGIDRSVGEILWTPDAKRLLFTAEDGPYVSLFEVPAAGGDVLRVLKGIVTLEFRENDRIVPIDVGTLRSDFRIHPDGKTLVFRGERMNYPAEIMTAEYDSGTVRGFRQITTTNEKLLSELDLPAPESFTFKSFDGTPVQGWVLVPPGFDKKKTYPAIVLVHGGPQGQWSDEFHYRWNMELFAAPGFVIVAINPRGSTGFGQAFTDGVNGDWGGAPYRDIMTGIDAALRKYPFIDGRRLGAAGASYGGYMMDWMLGHTDRFKAIWSHAGVYDLASMYGGTEELWFPEWEFRGTPWTNPTMYEKFSPSRFAKNFRTPTYVSGGQLDFRVPIEQDMQLFTALQRRGVESKFLYFPDEGHFVLKPRNAQLWYREVHAWFRKHLMP